MEKPIVQLDMNSSMNITAGKQNEETIDILDLNCSETIGNPNFLGLNEYGTDPLINELEPDADESITGIYADLPFSNDQEPERHSESHFDSGCETKTESTGSVPEINEMSKLITGSKTEHTPIIEIDITNGNVEFHKK